MASHDKAKYSFLVIALGVAFEHFDMMLVSLLASTITEEFVAGDNLPLKLLCAYLGYAIAFLFRPLGAFCFGCIGDLYGRKTSLISSMVLMSTSTLALAFIPSAQVLGMTSAVFFFLCRIAQGLAVGGEYGTAMTYSYERDPNLRTFSGACVIAATHVGGLFASLLALAYAESFRMTFLTGGTIGFLLLAFRSFLKESHITTVKRVSEVARQSIKNRRAILKAVIVASMLVLIFYGSLIYLNELVHRDLGISRSRLFKANACLLGLWILLPPFFGYVADKFVISYIRMMRFGAVGVFLSAPFLGLALAASSYPAVLMAQIVIHLFHMLFCLCTPRFFGDLFADQARNTAISTCYSLGASFTAALAPMICHMSIALFHTNFAVCIPFMGIALAVISIIKKEDLCERTIPLNSTT